MSEKTKYPNLEALINTIEILRSPNGCAWDREQTHATLKRNILEESYEMVDAINSGDLDNLKEELGDVLLQVVLHSQIAKEENHFNIEDVAKRINEKLIHRHPHVFGNIKENNPEKIIENWEKIKKQEKTERKSQMDG
ncbi:MazG family protein, partial [bacterium]|nr:MazG family protein [bacterium]